MMVRRRKRVRVKILRVVGMMVFVCLLVGVFLLSGFLVWAANIEMPDFRLFEERKIAQSTKIYDRTGEILLFDVHKDIRRTIVPLDNIDTDIQNATIAIEDDRFYSHVGIEPTAIIRAILVNLGLREGYSGQGGSTITQQVIKMALLTSEKTITRKVKEWILAIRLERVMSKEQILALYLNEAPYGGNIYGVEEAAMAFFGKSAKDVTLAEAAYLASLPQAPTLYSPFGSNRELLERRKNLILDRMKDLGMINEETYTAAKNEQVKFIPPTERGIQAPHFVLFVREQLAKKYGEEALNEGGLRVITTLDMDLQRKAEEIVKKHALENTQKYNASNAALVALDPKTGEILAMVGSRDYFDKTIDGNYNIATANRQPGSAFKPLVYAAGLELGYTPKTVLFDVPTQFSTRCDAFGNPQGSANPEDCYMPVNYDGNYRGPITLKDALAQSVNIPAVKMLYLVGIDRALEIAKRFGISTLTDKGRYGLTLVLGGGEVSLLELTSAYGVFAAEGKRFPYQSVLRVEDHLGSVIEEYTPRGDQVIDTEITRKISDMLSDNDARTPAFGNRSYLYFPDREVAVKTGTTNDYRDAWIVGYTPSLVVGAWAGNNDNSPMEKKVAGFIVAPLWNEFFLEAFKKIPYERFSPPLPVSQAVKPALRGVWYGSDTYMIDRFSGKLATEFTPEDARIERVVPNPHEILHWVDKENPTGPIPQHPEVDPQYHLWEIPAQLWILQHGIPEGSIISSRPVEYDDVHTPEKLPVGFFISPTTTQTYHLSDKISVEAFVRGVFPITSVEFYFNNQYIGSSTFPPYIISFSPEEYGAQAGRGTVKMVMRDFVLNTVEHSIDILLLP